LQRRWKRPPHKGGDPGEKFPRRGGPLGEKYEIPLCDRVRLKIKSIQAEGREVRKRSWVRGR